MNPIYLDYQATTPLAPEAHAAMEPWLAEKFGNPHSPHRMGREAKAAVEVARDQVLQTLIPTDLEPRPTLDDGRLAFTSGATEALNWAIKGVFEIAPSNRNKIVTIATEHAAVLDSVRSLEARGAEVLVLPVDRGGLIDLDQIYSAVDERTALVAAMYVNNEIGTAQHVGLMHLSARAREVGAAVLCDAVQVFGRLSFPLMWCDLVAISAHKVHGPKGIGALWIRKGFEPAPLLHGGGQEFGIRSGTLSPALCVGFGAAARLARERKSDDWQHVVALYEKARAVFRENGWHVNGSRKTRYPGNLNVRADGLDAARLISDVRGVAFSAGSACASGSGRPSHVLKAIGLSDAEARSSIRLGFGRYTTEAELDRALDLILEAAAAQGLKAA